MEASDADRRELYVYQDGYYKSGDAILRGEVERIIQEDNSGHIVTEIIRKIKDSTAQAVPRTRQENHHFDSSDIPVCARQTWGGASRAELCHRDR